MIVKYHKLTETAVAPAYQTLGAAGLDICADETAVLSSGSYSAISTGIALELPVGVEAQVRPRSGLAAKYGVTVLNSPGTIDSDYRGEVRVILINHGPSAYRIEKGSRIAQLVFARVATAILKPVLQLSETVRGKGGLGSTGT
jgi:dUTP pyrophosphatase